MWPCPGCGRFDSAVTTCRTRIRRPSQSVTFLDFEADDDRADELAHALAAALLPDDGWYADFQSDAEHFVAFSGAVFRYRKGDSGQGQCGRLRPMGGNARAPTRLGESVSD